MRIILAFGIRWTDTHGWLRDYGQGVTDQTVQCSCGAPALYGADEPLYCGEHAPDDCRCMACAKPLLDASESFCEGCLEPDDGDGITEYGEVWVHA